MRIALDLPVTSAYATGLKTCKNVEYLEAESGIKFIGISELSVYDSLSEFIE
ncbi:3228_t:CDS:2 [Gigaspora margarita]|uniref:3228_t:CDS:1 n=1 Tax=Gigaspora margarita TaxID=4874 RepID=A0ABM8W6D1_GIGMA|nr:3228_t:CDS:2 [Gigaspora margarita]